MKNIKILLSLLGLLVLFSNIVKAESYLYGGPKLFYYDVTQEDLDKTAQDLVNLGFSTAKVEANTGGIGFDIGVGGGFTDQIDFELGFVYMGEFELKATLTGPTENLTAKSSAWSIPAGFKYKLGDSDANVYVKGGAHYWKQNSEISASKGVVSMWGTGIDPMFGIGGELGGMILSYEHYSFSGIGAGAGIGDGGLSAVSIQYKAEF